METPTMDANLANPPQNPGNPPQNPANPANPANQNQYVINNVQQLFELNQNLVNFKSSFMVKSLSNEPFMGIVLNQHILDSGELPEFKLAEQGFFSGEITQDNNVYTNWYLALKSTKPNKVMIQIQTVPIAAREAYEPTQMVQHGQHGQRGAHESYANHARSSSSMSSYFTTSNLMTLIAVAAVIVTAYYGYRYYVENIKHKPAMNEIAASLLPTESVSAPAVSSVSSVSPVSSFISAPAVSVPILSTPAPSVIPVAAAAAAVAAAAPVTSVLDSIETMSLGGSSTTDILGSDLMKQINNLPTL